MQSGYSQYIDTLLVQFHLIFVLDSSKYVRNCGRQIKSRAILVLPKIILNGFFRFGSEYYSCFTALGGFHKIGNIGIRGFPT